MLCRVLAVSRPHARFLRFLLGHMECADQLSNGSDCPSNRCSMASNTPSSMSVLASSSSPVAALEESAATE